MNSFYYGTSFVPHSTAQTGLHQLFIYSLFVVLRSSEPVCVGAGQHRAALRQTGPRRDPQPAHVLPAHPEEYVRR